MATTRKPSTRATKPRNTKPIEDPEHNEEPTQIKVAEEPKETAIKIRPDLYERLMKIGDHAYWSRILENYYNELAKRYRR